MGNSRNVTNSIDQKKIALKKYNVTLLDGTDKNIFIKYKDIVVPYNTNNFLLYTTDFLVKEILEMFNIDEYGLDYTQNFKDDLSLKRKYLDKLTITKYWISERFYLKKDGIDMLYNFDDYIDMEPDLFIADVINKFNKLETNITFVTDIKKTDKGNIIVTPRRIPTIETPVIDVDLMKKNIKKILIERGILI